MITQNGNGHTSLIGLDLIEGDVDELVRADQVQIEETEVEGPTLDQLAPIVQEILDDEENEDIRVLVRALGMTAVEDLFQAIDDLEDRARLIWAGREKQRLDAEASERLEKERKAQAERDRMLAELKNKMDGRLHRKEQEALGLKPVDAETAVEILRQGMVEKVETPVVVDPHPSFVAFTEKRKGLFHPIYVREFDHEGQASVLATLVAILCSVISAIRRGYRDEEGYDQVQRDKLSYHAGARVQPCIDDARLMLKSMGFDPDDEEVRKLATTDRRNRLGNEIYGDGGRPWSHLLMSPDGVLEWLKAEEARKFQKTEQANQRQVDRKRFEKLTNLVIEKTSVLGSNAENIAKTIIGVMDKFDLDLKAACEKKAVGCQLDSINKGEVSEDGPERYAHNGTVAKSPHLSTTKLS